MDAPKLNTPIAVGRSQSTHHPSQQSWMIESSIGVSKDLNVQGTSISAITPEFEIQCSCKIGVSYQFSYNKDDNGSARI